MYYSVETYSGSSQRILAYVEMTGVTVKDPRTTKVEYAKEQGLGFQKSVGLETQHEGIE